MNLEEQLTSQKEREMREQEIRELMEIMGGEVAPLPTLPLPRKQAFRGFISETHTLPEQGQ